MLLIPIPSFVMITEAAQMNIVCLSWALATHSLTLLYLPVELLENHCPAHLPHTGTK